MQRNMLESGTTSCDCDRCDSNFQYEDFETKISGVLGCRHFAQVHLKDE